MHQKWAGSLPKDVILVFVDVQIPGNEISRFHFLTFGQPFNVLFCNHRADARTAIGASQTIELFKRFIVKLMKHIIEVFGLLRLQFFKERGKFLLPAGSQLF